MPGEAGKDIGQVPARGEALPVSVSVLQHVLNAVLTYHYGQSNRTEPADTKRLIEAINKHLGAIFFETLFVLRPDIRTALRKITLEPLCILHGGRGTGKTTSILYISSLIMRGHDPPSTILEIGEDTTSRAVGADRTDLLSLLGQIRHDPHWYFVLDVEASRNELSKTRTICHFLFDRLYQRALERLEDFSQHWEEYLQVRYTELAQAIKALDATLEVLKSRGLDDPALIAPLAQSIHDTRMKFDQDSGTLRVELLLEFLDRNYGVAAGFAVDNIDLFDESLQKSVALAMYNLCYTKKLLHHSIIGVRSENLPVIFDALRGHTVLSREDAIDVSIRTEGFEVLVELLRRRLSVIPDLLELPEVQDTYRSQRESGYLPEGDPSENADRLFDAVDVVTGLLAPSHDRPSTVPLDSTADKNYLTQLLQWNNNSLRAVLAASYHVGFLIASDSDPTFPFSQLLDHRDDFKVNGSHFDGKRFGKLVRSRVRYCRSFFIRQFVAISIQPLEFSHDLLLYEKPKHPVPNGQLPYLRLHLLQALAHRGDKSTIDELCRLVRPFGSSPGRTKEALEGLRQPASSRRPDDRGLIHVDSGSQAQDASGATAVTLLPAGRHMVDDLCYMSDYIFWNAFNTYNAEIFLGARRDEITPSQLADEEFRIAVSLGYLENRIVPRYLGIYGLETYQSQSRNHLSRPDITEVLSNYLETFGSTPVPIGIAQEIADFTLKGRHINQDFKNDIVARTREVQLHASQPFFDVSLRHLLTSRRTV